MKQHDKNFDHRVIYSPLKFKAEFLQILFILKYPPTNTRNVSLAITYHIKRYCMLQ